MGRPCLSAGQQGPPVGTRVERVQLVELLVSGIPAAENIDGGPDSGHRDPDPWRRYIPAGSGQRPGEIPKVEHIEMVIDRDTGRKLAPETIDLLPNDSYGM